MLGYILKRILFMIPTLFADLGGVVHPDPVAAR